VAARECAHHESILYLLTKQELSDLRPFYHKSKGNTLWFYYPVGDTTVELLRVIDHERKAFDLTYRLFLRKGVKFRFKLRISSN